MKWVLYSHLHHHSASQRHNIKDRRMNKRRMIKNARRIKIQEGRHKKTSFQIYLPLTLLQGFERVVWGFACERMLETERKLHILTPLLWPSRCVFIVLLMFNQRPWGPLHWGFPRTPSVGCGLPYHIWSLLSGSLLATASGVSEVPRGQVWPSLPHLVSNPLGVCWQLLWDPNSTELNNNSTPTWSPTGSLKSNV